MKGMVMKNKKMWIMITILIFLLGGCFGDRVISEVVFAYQCKNNVGFFVYETVSLSDEYVIPIPNDVRKRDLRYQISESQMLDKKKLNAKFNIKHQEHEVIFPLGPVYSVVSSVVKVSDGKKLGEVVTFARSGGWLNRTISKTFPGGSKSCPTSIRNNQLVFENSKMHLSLVNKLFKIK